MLEIYVLTWISFMKVTLRCGNIERPKHMTPLSQLNSLFPNRSHRQSRFFINWRGVTEAKRFRLAFVIYARRNHSKFSTNAFSLTLN